ncbi:MAG: hypothetical protein COT17_05600 [Elusimicrobia bacterium CG08_land_8_20_14_0_20_51_18]|nr:MAG: hypothetical protein COT17_05600 [Elusimicrobia bacterium CG08_land_8_20_14_0_20_51_18]
MKKFFKWAGAILAIVSGIALFIAGLRLFSVNSFVLGWEERFPEYRDKMDQLPAVDLRVGIPEGTAAPAPFEDAKLVKVSFPDGSWLFVAEHDTHDDGLGWDRAVFYDSRGDMRATSHHFCDWEGLLGEMTLYSKDAKTLDDFYKAAAGIKFEE